MKFEGHKVDHAYTHFEEKPTYEEVEALATRYAADFVAGKLHRLDIAYTKFLTPARQIAVLETLLPIGDLTASSTSKAEAAASPTTQAKVAGEVFTVYNHRTRVGALEFARDYFVGQGMADPQVGANCVECTAQVVN